MPSVTTLFGMQANAAIILACNREWCTTSSGYIDTYADAQISVALYTAAVAASVQTLWLICAASFQSVLGDSNNIDTCQVEQ